MSLPAAGVDAPQLVNADGLNEASTWLLANQEVSFLADAQSDMRELFLYRAAARYARSMRLTLSTFSGSYSGAFEDEPLLPTANRYYPGYQETILGTEEAAEGLIVSKRLIAPLQSAEDRSLLWQLECQAEGDTLMRMDVEIEWGEPLTQRLVDGLLVAQRDPQPGKGIYRQSSAASTRIFGNPNAPPDKVEFDDEAGTARMSWHVLVNGEVDVELLLTLSDVGEQMAWNGFLALRDSDRAREQTMRAWQRLLGAGRLWTPDMALNHKVNGARRRALLEYVRWKPGFAPADRAMAHMVDFVAALDAIDPVLSRNLLAHVRRLAERTVGRLPERFVLEGEEVAPRSADLVWTNLAYLKALHEHLLRFPNPELLQEHYAAVTLCAEVLIGSRAALQEGASERDLRALEDALRQALRLATLKRDGVNAVRWESEACEYKRVADELAESQTMAAPSMEGDKNIAAWQTEADAPAQWQNAWAAVAFANATLWKGLGYTFDGKQIRLKPAFPQEWGWWAVLDLPTPLGALTVVWDGAMLHSNLPLKTALPHQVHARISLRGADEIDFAPRFIFAAEEGEIVFRPQFLPPPSQL